VQILIQHGADVTARDETYSTPLHVAASLPFTGNIVRMLLSLGANVGAKDDRGRTPYQIASSRGLFEISGLLLSDV
jgi:ankyrin repeat protein